MKTQQIFSNIFLSLFAVGLALRPATATAQATIGGTVFEDVNYGGGSGRNLATASASAAASGLASIASAGTRVELYNASGTFVAAATTAANGSYSFGGLAAGSYVVRVPSGTVQPARAGGVAGLLPVQTYRTANGAADPERVGGENPTAADATPATGQTLSFTGAAVAGDNTAFVDLVEILDATNTVVAGLPVNPSFETPNLGTGNGSYQYSPGGATWSFPNGTGIAANGSAFNVGGGNPVAPDGTQVAFVQSYNGSFSSFSQGFSLSSGTYTIRFRAAQRTNNVQALTVAINGTSLGTFQPASSAYTTFTTASFTVVPATNLPAGAQNIAPVTLGATDATGVDFGFNFSTVVNVNDAGQGSLRQFLANANALANTGLDQDPATNPGGPNPAAGVETTIFMVGDGVAHPGLRAGLPNQLTGTAGTDQRAVFAVLSLLTCTGPNTAIDGRTQTVNIGDTNPGTLGTSDVVGVDGLPLTPVARPEVSLLTTNANAMLLTITGAGDAVRYVALRGGTNATVATSATGFVIEENIIGGSATNYAYPNDNTVSANYGVNITGGAGLFSGNLVGFTGNSGVNINNGTGNATIITLTGNEFTQNGYTSAGGDAISLGDAGGAGPVLVEGNLFTRSNSSAVQFEIGQTASSIVRNNTMIAAGQGGAGYAQSQLEGSAICYLQRDGNRRSLVGQTDLITKNIITDTQASAIVVGYGQQNVVISQNSEYANGAISIDHVTRASAYVQGPGNGNIEYGSGDGVTLNDGNDPAAAPNTVPNRGVDYPVLTGIDVVGGNLLLDGFCRPGAVVEIFIPQVDPTRFGEGRTYLVTRTEGTADDTDGGTGSYGPGAISGVPQGQDPAASRFHFTIPFSSLTAAQQATILQVGVTTTATIGTNTSEFSANITFTADVVATVAVGTTPVSSGQPGQFNVSFTNVGASTANGVVAFVQLPTGLNVSSVTGGGVYDPATGRVTYSGITSIVRGQVFSSVITFVQPATTGSVTAVAAISTTTSQAGVTANDSQQITITTLPAFDLFTTLNGPASVGAGQLATYFLTTQNAGPSPAPNATQTVSLNTGVALTNVFLSNGGTYSFSGGVSTFTFPIPGSLPRTEVITNTISFAAPVSGPLTLTALVQPNTAAGGETNPPNNTTSVTTTVGPAPTVSANVYTTISANAPGGSVAAGAPVTYTVVQGNNGPSAAQNVALQVALSPNLTTTGFQVDGQSGTASGSGSSAIISFALPGGTAVYDVTTGVLTFPVLATQTSSTSVTHTVVAPAPATGFLTTTASVRASTADPVLADNVASTRVTVDNLANADVSTNIVGPVQATAGQALTYTVVSTNRGPGQALNAVQFVNIAAGLPLAGPNAVLVNGAAPTTVSGTVATYGTGPTAATYDASSGVLRIPVPGILFPGSSVTNTLTYVAPVGNGTLSNVAVVRSDATDPVPANNVASLQTPVSAQADVAVVLTGPASSTVGAPVTIQVLTTNNGPSPSPSQTTTVQLPSGLAGVEVRGYDGAVLAGAYNALSGRVTFPALSNLPAGSAATQRGSISFITPGGNVITPTANVSVSGVDDSNLNNNATALSISISPASASNPDVSTAFVGLPGTAAAGSTVAFTVQTANSAAAPATGVVQEVALPAGLNAAGFAVGGSPATLDPITGFYNFAVPGGTATYDPGSGRLVIPIGNLGTGSTVNTALAFAAPGRSPLVLTATATLNETDTNGGNNRTTATVPLSDTVDVATAVSGPATASAGSTVTYGVVTQNNGPSVAANVVQTLTIPAGATNVTITGGGTQTGNVITFPTITSLQPGGANSVTNSVIFTVPTGATTFTVKGQVSATGDTAPSGNNVSSFTTTAPANLPPLAQDVVNYLQAPRGETAGPLPIAPLQGTDIDGSIASFTVTQLPTAAQGLLYYLNGATLTLVAVGQALTPSQAATLYFDPTPGYIGNVFFYFQATDNGNGTPANALSSNVARYTIPVGQDNPSLYAALPTNPGAYATNQTLANVFDNNGGKYTAAGAVDSGPNGNGLVSAALTPTSGPGSAPAPSGNPGNALPPGTALDPATGRIYVSNPAQLVPGTYTVNVTTVDLFGGTNTQPVTFVIGPYPLPVELLAFAAKAVQNADAALTWRTASERNSAYWSLERSADGKTFAAFARLDAQGNTSRPTDYRFVDRAAAQRGALAYYRLRQVDLDGRESLSPVQVVRFTGTLVPALGVYPNPATTSVSLDLSALPTGSYRLQVLDALGRTVRTQALPGGSNTPVNLANLATGQYLLQLSGQEANAGLVFRQRLTKE